MRHKTLRAREPSFMWQKEKKSILWFEIKQKAWPESKQKRSCKGGNENIFQKCHNNRLLFALELCHICFTQLSHRICVVLDGRHSERIKRVVFASAECQGRGGEGCLQTWPKTPSAASRWPGISAGGWRAAVLYEQCPVRITCEM